MRSSSRAAGRLATSAVPTRVQLMSSSCSVGRGGSTAAGVRFLQCVTSRYTSDGGRVTNAALERLERAACSFCNAGRCANDACGVIVLHLLISSSTRPGGRDASVAASKSVPLARSTRSWLRSASDTPARWLEEKAALMSSSCNAGGKPFVSILARDATSDSLQSSDTSAVKCATLARADRL